MTSENWGYCHYKSLQLKAFISLGGEPMEQESKLLYMLTLTDHEHNEVFQSLFPKLEDAILEINSRYSHWEFIDPEDPKNKEGCTDCSAH